MSLIQTCGISGPVFFEVIASHQTVKEPLSEPMTTQFTDAYMYQHACINQTCFQMGSG